MRRKDNPWLPDPFVLDETIDDLRIYVGDLPAEATIQGRAGPHYWRTNETGPTQPLVGFASLHREADVRTAMHEIGHVLGIGGVGWRSRQGLLAGEGEDRHFLGGRALAAWWSVGGERWPGPAVPAEADDGHWKKAAFGDELMTPTWRRGAARPLSEVTIQALADMGYTVDVSQAEPYSVPATGKLVATMGAVGVCGVGPLMRASVLAHPGLRRRRRGRWAVDEAPSSSRQWLFQGCRRPR